MNTQPQAEGANAARSRVWTVRLNPAQHMLIIAVLAYRRVVSPVLVVCFGHACRFEPTCSGYALEAVRRHGAVRGAWLAVRRLARCHPWGGCGHDPVPAPKPAR